MGVNSSKRRLIDQSQRIFNRNDIWNRFTLHHYTTVTPRSWKRSAQQTQTLNTINAIWGYQFNNYFWQTYFMLCVLGLHRNCTYPLRNINSNDKSECETVSPMGHKKKLWLSISILCSNTHCPTPKAAAISWNWSDSPKWNIAQIFLMIVPRWFCAKNPRIFVSFVRCHSLTFRTG